MATLEQITSEVWRCPHCQYDSTILSVMIEFVDGAPTGRSCCPECLQEGIEPLGKPDLRVVEGGASHSIEGWE